MRRKKSLRQFLYRVLLSFLTHGPEIFLPFTQRRTVRIIHGRNYSHIAYEQLKAFYYSSKSRVNAGNLLNKGKPNRIIHLLLRTYHPYWTDCVHYFYIFRKCHLATSPHLLLFLQLNRLYNNNKVILYFATALVFIFVYDHCLIAHIDRIYLETVRAIVSKFTPKI